MTVLNRLTGLIGGGASITFHTFFPPQRQEIPPQWKMCVSTICTPSLHNPVNLFKKLFYGVTMQNDRLTGF